MRSPLSRTVSFDGGTLHSASDGDRKSAPDATLAALLAREGALPYERVVELLLPVISAVAALHASGIAHRQLKPANILLLRDEAGALVPTLADVGRSNADDDRTVTKSGATLRTSAYRARKPLHGAARADEDSDHYALGVILYECLTAQLPFDGATLHDRTQAATTTAPRAPSELRSRVPTALDAIVLRALQHDSALRFASVDDLGTALLSFAAPDVRARWAGELTAGRAARVAHSSEKFGWKAIVAGASLLAIVMAMAFQYAKPPPPMAPDAMPPVQAEPAVAISRALVGYDPPIVPGSIASSVPTAPAKRSATPKDESHPSPPLTRESGENEAPIIDPD